MQYALNSICLCLPPLSRPQKSKVKVRGCLISCFVLIVLWSLTVGEEITLAQTDEPTPTATAECTDNATPFPYPYSTPELGTTVFIATKCLGNIPLETELGVATLRFKIMQPHSA